MQQLAESWAGMLGGAFDIAEAKPQAPTLWLRDLGEITSPLWACSFSYILTLKVPGL